MLERFTCYNGSSPNCDGLAVTPPFTQVDTTESYNGGSQALTKTMLASTGELITELAKYSGSTLLESTSYTYNSLGEVLSTTTTDGSGNTVAVSTYGYDETAVTATSGIPQHTTATARRGNLTSSHVYTAGSTALTTTTSYYDTGQPISTVTPGSQTTQYGYDSTQTFQTSTIFPTPSSGVGLSTSATYNTASASLLTSTGMNAGQTTSINQYDVFLRPTSVTLPNGGSITYSYTSPVQETVTQSLNASTGEVSESAVFLDPYGRNSRVAVYNGQSSNPWYQADSCYDQSGFLKFRATAYQGQGGSSSIVCSGSGTAYQYDALGRVTQAANNDGTQSITYNNRAVETTDVNGVQRITQYDLLGRMSGVCEISSNPMGGQSPTPCGMDISGTGYVTSYAYNLAAHTVTITQGSQQRAEQTDEAGEVIAVTEPERGSTTYSYSYNSTGLQVVRTRPKANQTSATTLTHTTTQYDSLGRVVSISYDDGITPAKSYYYDTLPAALQWSQSPAYPKGQLVGTASGSGTTLTRSEFSYDISGNVLSMWQCAPSICGGASQQSRGATQLLYDLGGNLTYESDPASGGITYGRTPAGEISSMTSTYNSTGNPPTLVSNVVNTPFGPTSYALGNGLNQVTTYDTLGRSNGSWVCNGSLAAYCTNGSQFYGNTDGYQGSRVSSACDTVLNQCQSNGYDEFNRLTSITDNSHNTGDIGSYTYTYDRYGNRLTQTSQSGGPSPSYSYDNGNHLMSAGYDAAGNETSDGISHTYTYDAEGNVMQVDSGNTAQYVYDAFNRRVSVQTSAGSYEYVFDPSGHRLSTWAVSSNSGIEGRIYMNGGQIAFRAEDGTTYFQHMSPLGTVRLRTNYEGQVAATESSLPYGDNFLQSGSTYADQDNQEYAGQDYDSESTTSHAQFRQYSMTQGRWMSPDPYDGSYDFTNPQSLNRYSYALNNPLIFVDPTGTDCQPIYNSDTGAVGCEDGGEPDVGPGGNPPSPQTPNNTINVTVVLSPYGYVTTLLAMDTAALDNFGPPVNPAGWPSPMLSANFTGNVGGAGAPSNLPTLKQLKCGALAGLPVAVDAASLVADFAGPEGQAAKIAVGFGLSLAATFTSAANGDAGGAVWGAASFTRAPLEVATKSAGLTGLANWIPGVGAFGDGIAAIHDISGVKGSYGACMAR